MEKKTAIMKKNRFRVRVESVDDLPIVSSMLQDSIIPIADLKYIPNEKKFFMISQRFCWELYQDQRDYVASVTKNRPKESLDNEIFERVLCAVVFEGIDSVHVKGLDLKDRGQFLNFLSFNFKCQQLDLIFSDHKTIRLCTKLLKFIAEDVGQSWPTTRRPIHWKE
ncbi:MAG: hypothetical protein CMM58_09400 [Rhodospirillaceae bacterium]|nr:hypothetical protein [Rhodospirillaceae bacterium]|tara:strand:+ start:57 stop:554 length:498 start_codon:yes stop_codon:yes gene_type:complete